MEHQRFLLKLLQEMFKYPTHFHCNLSVYFLTEKILFKFYPLIFRLNYVKNSLNSLR